MLLLRPQAILQAYKSSYEWESRHRLQYAGLYRTLLSLSGSLFLHPESFKDKFKIFRGMNTLQAFDKN